MLDATTLQPFQNAAGHGGIMSDTASEIIVKPCTQAEIDFYTETAAQHQDFLEYIPTFMGTITLGEPHLSDTDGQTTLLQDRAASPAPGRLQESQGRKIATDLAIVLENLEYGFTKPNVIDIKLGARLYAPGTAAEKAARLDKVASETTSGSLNFRIAGMKVWNAVTQRYDIYDKQYGRTFDEATVKTGLDTFFDSLIDPSIRSQSTVQVLTEVYAELISVRQVLESKESRFYSSSILIVYEGDNAALHNVIREEEQWHRQQEQDEQVEHHEPTSNQKQSDINEDLQAGDSDNNDDDDDDDDDDDEPQPAFRLKLIDFAHATWCPGAGKDDNVITGLLNLERQMHAILNDINRS